MPTPSKSTRALRTVNPSPYMYYLELDDMYSSGLAGDAHPRRRRRHRNPPPLPAPAAGAAMKPTNSAWPTELQNSEKERAEHIMLVDLARNDLGRVCEAGSVRVTSLMAIERYSHVMHLVSHVVGKLRPGISTYDALRAYFPTARSPAPRKSGQWKSSLNSKGSSAAVMAVASATSTSAAIATPPSPSAQSG